MMAAVEAGNEEAMWSGGPGGSSVEGKERRYGKCVGRWVVECVGK